MDTRNSRLIVALASVMILIVTGVAWYGIKQTKDSIPQIGNIDDSRAYQRSRYKRRQPGRSVGEEQLSKRRLRELLEQRSRALRDRSAELRQSSIAYEKLKTQFAELESRYQHLQRNSAENTTLLVDLVAQINQDSEADRQESSPTLPEMQLIDIENEEANTQNAELTLVQWQLELANDRVRELETEILQEMFKSTEATRALIGAGEAAVPVIAELLTDANPEIRLWAADVLGQIGRPAILAADRLIQAMSDPNQEVRKAAESALDRIEGRS